MAQIERRDRGIQRGKFSRRTGGSRREGTRKLVSWNIAGAKNIREAWDYDPEYDWIMLQETWMEEKMLER